MLFWVWEGTTNGGKLWCFAHLCIIASTSKYIHQLQNKFLIDSKYAFEILRWYFVSLVFQLVSPNWGAVLLCATQNTEDAKTHWHKNYLLILHWDYCSAHARVERLLPHVDRQWPHFERQLPNVERHLPHIERQLPLIERQLPHFERQLCVFKLKG